MVGPINAVGKLVNRIFLWWFQIYQAVLSKLLSPTPPPPGKKLRRPRIAIVGAGITGVAAASHCVGHGFDVMIYEAGGKKSLGGIWAKVNNTSGLQIHSVMYRFFPSVHWSTGYPNRKEIVDAVVKLWKTYGLEDKVIHCLLRVSQYDKVRTI